MTGLTRRELAIVRLLETHDLNLPTSSPQSQVTSGFVHKERSRTCPDCLANGRISPSCETCFGRGHVDPRYAKIAAADALADDADRRDPYSVSKDKKTSAYGLDGSRHDAAHRRDREIENLARQTRPARKEAELLDEANAEPYAWERAREQMRKRFDHAALDLALEQLRQHDQVAYRALHAVWVYRWLAPADAKIVEPTAVLDAIGGTAAVACRRGLRFLSPRLAAVELARRKPLRAPDVPPPVVNMTARGRGADRRALDQRDGAVVAALDEPGATATKVAERFGLSVSQVNRIRSATSSSDIYRRAS